MSTQNVDGVEYVVHEISGRFDVRPAVPHATRTVLFDERVVERHGSVPVAVTESVRWVLARA